MNELPSFFKYARVISEFGDHRCKIGAALIFKGRPLSIGFNQKLKSHPFSKKFNEYPFIHAELSCILRCKNKNILPRCTLVTYRMMRNGNLGPSRPCKACIEILNFYDIKHIFYTTCDGYKEEYL